MYDIHKVKLSVFLLLN